MALQVKSVCFRQGVLDHFMKFFGTSHNIPKIDFPINLKQCEAEFRCSRYQIRRGLGDLGPKTVICFRDPVFWVVYINDVLRTVFIRGQDIPLGRYFVPWFRHIPPIQFGLSY